MTADIDLQLASTSEAIPSAAQLQQWADAALDNKTDTAELSIRIVDREESKALNHQYRHSNKPTNVLSFPAELPDAVDLPLLGDLVICADVVNAEAAAQAKTPEAHWAHIVIHGTLHLLGYDHIDDKEAEEMETLETKILAQLGYDCPY